MEDERYNIIYWSNYYYIENIVIYAHKNTKIKEHEFQVLHPNVIRYSIKASDPGCRICAIKKDKQIFFIKVEKKISKVLYDSICALSELVSHTPYLRRFMALYKSFEALTNSIPFYIKAIRHGIFHSPNVLSSPKTIQTLENIFGTRDIDFSIYKHRKLCYEYFAFMMIEHDKVLHKSIIDNLSNLVIIKKDKIK